MAEFLPKKEYDIYETLFFDMCYYRPENIYPFLGKPFLAIRIIFQRVYFPERFVSTYYVYIIHIILYAIRLNIGKIV